MRTAQALDEVPRSRGLASRVVAVLFALGAAACGASPAMRAAEAGRFDEARRAVAGEGARELAEAVARGEITRASGPIGAEALREFSGCVRALDEALAAKAEGEDEAAAAAAAMRIEAAIASDDELDRAAGLVTGHAGGLAPRAHTAWRRAGARALFRPGNGEIRRALFIDGDEGVRLGALRASLAAGEVDDADGALEAARLDPYPIARTTAIRAAGAIGGERVVLALKDVWATGDEASRQAIADAWATPRSIEVGGRRELLWAQSSGGGAPAIAAAYALVRAGGAGASDAEQVLVRAIEGGLGRDRVFAIGVAPIEGVGVREALAKAKGDGDDAVVDAALARLLDAATAAERPGIVATLVAIANGETRRAAQAKGVLARAGAREVAPILLRDVASKDATTRQIAGTSLALLGEAERAVPLVLDADAHVRRQVACAVLRSP